MTEKATFQQAQTALSERPDEILRQIPVGQVQLSLPLDGAGVRIKASVPHGRAALVPKSIEVFSNGETVEIAVEACEDYEPMEAL